MFLLLLILLLLILLLLLPSSFSPFSYSTHLPPPFHHSLPEIRIYLHLSVEILDITFFGQTDRSPKQDIEVPYRSFKKLFIPQSHLPCIGHGVMYQFVEVSMSFESITRLALDNVDQYCELWRTGY